MVSFLDKQRRRRVSLSFKQIEILSISFLKNIFPTMSDIKNLAKELKISVQQVRVWFQNQRQKAKALENNFINNLIKKINSGPKMSKLEILAEISLIEYEVRNKSS